MKNSKPLVLVEISALKPAMSERHHSASQKAAVAQSLVDYGQVRPILITPNNEILDGTLVCKLLEQAGATHVWAMVLYDLTPTQLQALRVKIHRSALGAHWDPTALRLTLDSIRLAGADLQLAGYDEATFNRLSNEPRAINLRAATEQIDWGDTWLLGAHAIAFGRADDHVLIESMLGDRRPDVFAIELASEATVASAATGLSVEDSTDADASLRSRFNAHRRLSKDDTLFIVSLHWSQLESALVAATELGMPLLDVCMQASSKKTPNGLFSNTHAPILIFGCTSSAKRQAMSPTKLSNIWSKASRRGLPAGAGAGLTPDILARVAVPGAIIFDAGFGAGNSLFSAAACSRLFIGIEPNKNLLRAILSRWNSTSTPAATKFCFSAANSLAQEQEHGD